MRRPLIALLAAVIVTAAVYTPRAQIAITPAGGTSTDATITTSDITTNNATASKHGWLPKLDGNATHCLLGDGTFGSCTVGAGGGDFSSNTSTSVDSEVVIFSGTGGKTGKRSTATGIAHLASGVLTGSNVIESEITLADTTTNNATSSAHGFLPKLSNVATDFLTGVGTFVSDVVQTSKAATFGAFGYSFAASTSLLVPASAGYAPTADGSIGYDTTQQAYSAGGSGINGKLARVLSVTSSTTDTLSAGVTTEQAFAQTFTIPASYLVAGKAVRLTFMFQQTDSAGPPTVLFRLRPDSLTGTPILFQSLAAASFASVTNIGASFSVIVIGTAAPGASVNTITSLYGQAGSLPPSGRNTTAQPVLLATNASHAMVLTIQYGSVVGGNSFTLLGVIVEALN